MRQSIRSDAKPVAAAFGQVVLFWLASMAVLVGASAVVRHLAMRPEALAIGACASLATWLLSLVFLRWSGGSAASVGLEPDRRTPLRFTIGLAGGFVLVAAHMMLVVLFGFGHVHWVPAPTPATPALVATTAAGYLLLATREELAFRGYPLRRLEVVSGAWTAQVVLAGLFAIEHWLGGSGWLTALLGAGLGALVFGAAALASRGLALPLGLHAAWNIGD